MDYVHHLRSFFLNEIRVKKRKSHFFRQNICVEKKLFSHKKLFLKIFLPLFQKMTVYLEKEKQDLVTLPVQLQKMVDS